MIINLVYNRIDTYVEDRDKGKAHGTDTVLEVAARPCMHSALLAVGVDAGRCG